MLQSIEIENFRCFRRSRFENFGQVNLIGGKNNAGKTALLETLYLANTPTLNGIRFLLNSRMEDSHRYSYHPELAWKNFFFMQDKRTPIRISEYFYSKKIANVSISCIEGTVSVDPTDIKQNGNDKLIKIEDSEKDYGYHFSTLNIKSKNPLGASEISIPHSFFVSIPDPPPDQPSFLPAIFIPAGFKVNPILLARQYDEAKLRNDTLSTLQIFKKIDDSIEKIDTISLGEPRIYVFRKDQPPQPLNLFGDALNKVADLILRISNNPKCILLIDEIENGIHHTNQQEFWGMLIKLAVLKDVQIFATTHSAEMIQAFHAASIEEEEEDKVRYIEMLRSQRTNEIVGNHVDMKTLAYNFQNNNPYRGE